MKRKLLSILLCLAMALSLLPTAALAEKAVEGGGAEGSGQTNSVAQTTNGTKYETLQAAINAAATKDTVTLLADTRENVTINKAMTLDLNGHTLNGGTEKAKPALTITARTVTIKDSSAAQTGTIMREDTATNSGVSSHYVIDIQGNAWVMFESGIVKNNSGNTEGKGASLVRVGDDSVAEYPGLNIKGGTFTQDNFIVIKVDRGDLFLNGGTLNSANSYAVENWHRATIKGGTVNGAVSSWTYSGGSNSDLTISGGTVNGDVESISYDGTTSKKASVSITGGVVNGTLITGIYGSAAEPSKEMATIEVTSGTFKNDPSKYVVENSSVTNNSDGSFGVSKVYLCKIGDTGYYTMDEAFKAQTASGEPIVLLCDYTTGSPFNSGSINRTVDLNGHTWTCTGTDANSAAFEINNPNASLTVKNGKIVSSQLVGLIPSAMGGTIKYDNSSLTFENVEMSTTATSGIETNGNNTNDSVTLKNSTLNVPNGFGIYFPSSGTLTIDNSAINAKTMGVQVCAGSLNINEGSAITVSGDAVPKTEGDGAIQDGAAISIVNRTGYKGLGDITVTGGTFTAKSGNVAIKAYDWQNQGESNFTASDKVSVSGGTFNSEVPGNCCAPGFEPTKNDDGTYGVKIKANLAAEVLDAQGNTVGAYDTLTAAITAAQDGDTVVLLKNVTENVTISADKTITLDLNGKKLTNADEQDTITVALGASLTVTGTGTVDNVTHGKAAVYNKGTVILADGTYERSAEAGKDANDNGGNSFYTVLNHGNMTVEADVVVNNKGKYSSLFENGYFNYSNSDGVVNPTLTIKGGTFDGGLNTIKNDDNATLTIKDGTFQNYTQAAFQNHNIATVEGGTFIGGGSAKAVLQCGVCSTADEEHDKHQLTISSGYFFGEITKTVGTISITGGTFSSDPSVYVVGNGSANIVKRDGSEGAYTYTVLAKSGLTSGVYLTNPSGALASNYYVSSTANGVWTVSYSAPYSGGSSSYVPTYSVSTPSKTENGSVTVSPKNASKGDTVTVTVKPDSGYVLETLTVTDKNGNKLTLKYKGNGKYTFTMPAGKVEVKATFMEDNSMLNFFYDVPNGAYFYEAVKWAVKNGITTGVGNDLFAPEQPCTRAQIVTFLWRAAGSPEPKSAASGMTDVVSGSYYEKAVAWAIENGITTGTTTSTFSPDATCTRAQAVTFLARALNAKATSVAEFSDVPTNSYFADAVAWAAANGVTEGIGGGLFGSDNDCTRGQIVTFLYRAYNK